MKAVKYSSVNVNNVDQKELDSQLRGDRLIMGLDVAKKKEYAALADETGKGVEVVRWEHPWESRKFADFVDGLKPSRVQMVMEPTGSLYDVNDNPKPLIYQGGLQEMTGKEAEALTSSRRLSLPAPLLGKSTPTLEEEHSSVNTPHLP